LPTDFVQTFSLSKDFAPAFSSFEYAQYSAYAQDEISVNKDFRLTLGLRLELPTYQEIPQIQTNPMLLGLSFEKGEKIDQGVLPKNTVMWSPRIGFNWDLYGDRSLQIRGGTGIFTGKIPYVWAVAQSSSNNMIQVTQAFNTYGSTGHLLAFYLLGHSIRVQLLIVLEVYLPQVLQLVLHQHKLILILKTRNHGKQVWLLTKKCLGE